MASHYNVTHICVKQAVCSDLYSLFADSSCAHLILSYFHMHCKCRKCDRSRSSIHVAGGIACTSYPGKARLFTEEASLPINSAHLLNHSSLYMQESSKDDNVFSSSTFELYAIWRCQRIAMHIMSCNAMGKKGKVV